jgi:hypothetical protein
LRHYAPISNRIIVPKELLRITLTWFVALERNCALYVVELVVDGESK